MQKEHTKLTSSERDQLAIMKARGMSIRSIAKKLKRSGSTISEELKRNSYKGVYVAIHAQAKSTKRRSKANSKRFGFKNKVVYEYVLRKLRDGWSPEQIAGRLPKERPGESIHHETIYRYIYSVEAKSKKLWEYLPRKQKKRRKQTGRSVHRCRIPDRVSIHKRPNNVENRQTFGHWEGDSVIGKARRSGLHTQVERKTRFLKVVILDDLTAEETLQAQKNIFERLPDEAKRSTTVDNGKEFVKHKQFDIPVYFADPYSSWQRGTNEYHNGLLRRYLPKKSDFRLINQEELNDMVAEINNRPRKCLGYNTPYEEFQKELHFL